MGRTSSKRRFVVGLVIAVGAAGALAALLRAESRTQPNGDGERSTSAPADGPKGLMFGFAPNTTYRYALHYASKTKAVPLAGMAGASLEGAQTVEGDLALEGALAMHAYPASTKDDGEGALVGLSLGDCKGHFRIGDQNVWRTAAGNDAGCRAVFDGKELLIRVNALGKVTAVHAAEGGASMFDYTMRAIVEEMQVRLTSVPGTSAWVEAEPLPQGNVESLYRVLSVDGEGASLERTRRRYLSLSAASMLDGAAVIQDESASHRIVLAHGVVDRIDGKESLKASAEDKTFLESKTELDVTLRERTVEELARPDLAHYTKRALEDMPESKTLRERMLEQRAAGLSWDEAVATIARYGDAGSVPDHNRFLWRTTALLELDPMRAWDLVNVFDGGRPGGKLRGLVLDLLASTRTPEAQKVMRQLLASEQARTDPRYAHLVQRMGFVDAPDKESIAFVKARYADATASRKKNDRFAAAYTMGSMADRAKSDGDERSAKDLVDDLSRAVRGARPEELVLFLNALANADSASAVDTFAGYAKHADPNVREAVADALDAPQTPKALETLLDLAGDPDRAVQRAALKSLRRYALTGPVLLRLAEHAEARRFVPENVRFVVDLVKTYRFALPREEEVLLRALLAGPIDDDLVRAAVQQLLDAR